MFKKYVRQGTRFTAWFDSYIRKNRVQKKKNQLVTTLLTKRNIKNAGEAERLYRILQLLTFIRQDENITKAVSSGNDWTELTFKIKNFLKFVGHDTESKYRQRQAMKFFEKFFEKSFIEESFRDKCFCALWKNFKKKEKYFTIKKEKNEIFVQMRVMTQMMKYSFP